MNKEHRDSALSSSIQQALWFRSVNKLERHPMQCIVGEATSTAFESEQTRETIKPAQQPSAQILKTYETLHA